MRLSGWLIAWVKFVKPHHKGVMKDHVQETVDDLEGSHHFHACLIEIIKKYPFDQYKRSRNGHRAAAGETESSAELSELAENHEDSQRIFATENQETVDNRQLAKTRAREEKIRREQLQAKMSVMPSQQNGRNVVIVNPGKLDSQEFVLLNPDFGDAMGKGFQLKPHQEQGLQFMWREITGSHENLQGCLLAQTMGLGKTMQTIALLVAISDAAKNPNDNIRNQVPTPLHESRTLILSPPPLVENWYDEIIMWRPKMHNLGILRKVIGKTSPQDRRNEIRGWGVEGGVLLLGTNLFRVLMDRKSVTYNEGIAEILWERPNIVILDEAHEIKSRDSKIAQAVKGIHCKSRVALTGSPLSNNLGEYFSLIDWVAPRYFGDYSDFKRTYETPISQGLWQESTLSQYKNARKRLRVLEWELEPKVHRADASALHNSLAGKMEFIVKVSLTTLQRDLYVDFVNNARGKLGANGHLACIAVLTLLCAHPILYYNSLLIGQKRDKWAPKASPGNVLIENETQTASSDESAQLEAYNMHVCMVDTMARVSDFLEKLKDKRSPELSNKMKILTKIIELCEAVGDKVLVFSHRISTLNYLADQLLERKIPFLRIDGQNSKPEMRPEVCKRFNEAQTFQVVLISTKAGGQGLNLYSANRVVILDEEHNPMHEQQAIGRAYRFGQKKRVYVYRIQTAGTFEQYIETQGRFKEQLASRVMDKKNLQRNVKKNSKEYFDLPQIVDPEDVAQHLGKDTEILDQLIKDPASFSITSITPFETFSVEETIDLTEEEQRDAEALAELEKLRRTDPKQYAAMMAGRNLGGQQPTGSLTSPDDLITSTASAMPSASHFGLPSGTPAQMPFQMTFPATEIYQMNETQQESTDPRQYTTTKVSPPILLPTARPVCEPREPQSPFFQATNALPPLDVAIPKAPKPPEAACDLGDATTSTPKSPGGQRNLVDDSTTTPKGPEASKNYVPAAKSTPRSPEPPCNFEDARRATPQRSERPHQLGDGMKNPPESPEGMRSGQKGAHQTLNGLPSLSKTFFQGPDVYVKQGTDSWSARKKELYAMVENLLEPSRNMPPSSSCLDNTMPPLLKFKTQTKFRSIFSKRGSTSKKTEDYITQLVEVVQAFAQSTNDWHRLVDGLVDLLQRPNVEPDLLIELLRLNFLDPGKEHQVNKRPSSITSNITPPPSKKHRASNEVSPIFSGDGTTEQLFSQFLSRERNRRPYPQPQS